ncbi:WD repeat-containing protein JIP5 [Flammula alnicola]|nr:WD repeat-containing protein JIP5 [Flammula alnicola]
MPEIPVGAQIFDVVFHPTFSTVYTGLLTGHVKAFCYDEQGNHKAAFSVRPSKSSCRGLSLDGDGSHLYAVGKGKALNTIDTVTESIDSRPGAHDSPINRVKYLMPWLLSTGDDDGTVKLWDPRQRDSIRTYTQHFDYISDFLWLDDKRQLVATSGDGTLSVMDVRSKKPEPLAQSEDQEDELLSIVAIKGATKVVVGTQLGILSIFNRSSGWGDCVDRVPGHPLSVDALCALPSDLPNVDTASTILTGSSDGYVRAVQILPTKLLGVVADHGEWPIERIAIESEHQKRWWVGSVGHEEVLRMTDLEGSSGIKTARIAKELWELKSRTRTVISKLTADQMMIRSKFRSFRPLQRRPSRTRTRAKIRMSPRPKSENGGEKGFPLIATKKKKGKHIVAIERSFFDEL